MNADQFLSEPERRAVLDRRGNPTSTIRMVLDTDTYNEIDDQFALAYALGASDTLDLEAIYAAPFRNSRSASPADGMEKSFVEIQHILELSGPKVAAGKMPKPFRGATEFLRTDGDDQYRPLASAAAGDLIDRAHRTPEGELLYVAAIAAITNVATAILLDPSIARNIAVVWLGGHALHWPHTREFNLQQDIHAARVLFDSGVPVVHIPCLGVASHLLTTESDVRANVAPLGALGAYLYEIYRTHEARRLNLAKEIWDISTIGYLRNPDWVPTHVVPSPILSDRATWSVDASRHSVRSAYYIRRGEIFQDMYSAIQRLA